MDTYAALRAKYERMRTEGSCVAAPATGFTRTAGPDFVEPDSSTERAFAATARGGLSQPPAFAGVTACQRCGGSGIARVVEDFRVLLHG
jgi:hypothetical protein